MTESWIIGSRPDCDIVLDEATVSGRHCRLSAGEDGYTIEDLGSTNGTFVNDQKITECTAVTRRDRVRLGKSLALPWPNSPTEVVSVRQPQRISIGRDPANDFVIDEASVSSQHAQLLIWEDRLEINDLDSRNGTFIGSVSNKVSRPTTIERDQTLFFGDAQVGVDELLKVCGVSLGPQLAKTVAGKRNREIRLPFSRLVLSLVAGGLGLVTIIVLVIVWRRGGDDKGPNLEQKADSQLAKDLPSPPASKSRKRSVEDLNRSVYAVVVRDPKTSLTYRLGTASAVGKRQLLTTASIVIAGRALSEDFSGLELLGSDGRRVPVTSTKVLPEYEKSDRDAKSIQAAYDIRVRELRSAAATSNLKEIQGKLTRALLQMVELRNRQTALDFGLLKVANDLPTSLSISPDSPQQAAVAEICGFPVPADSPLLPTGGLGQPTHQPISYSGQTSQRTILLPRHVKGWNWLGSPIVDDGRRIVSVYSRPAESGSSGEAIIGSSTELRRLLEAGSEGE